MGAESVSLSVAGLTVDYGGGPVVRDVSFDVGAGEVLALLGSNGSGRTSLLRTLAGFVPAAAGTITLDGTPLANRRPEWRARAGIHLIPDDGGLFPALSVQRHFQLAGRSRRANADVDEALDLLPQLRERWRLAAGALSGGEARMLAVAQAIVRKPRVLLVDELSFGLAPKLVPGLLAVLRRLAVERGTALVMVEQFVDLALDVADRAVVLSRGEPVYTGAAQELRSHPDLLARAYLGTPPGSAH